MTTPLIIAHRAQAGDALENTIAGMRAVSLAGVDLIEIDIRLSLDRRPVIVHDPLLGRTTSGRGPVAAWPSPLLRRLTFREGETEHIPLLRDALRLGDDLAPLALHVKSRYALGPVLRDIGRYGNPTRTWLWLSRAGDVGAARRRLPELRCTLLRPGSWTLARRGAYFQDAESAGASAVSVPSGAVAPDLLAHAHEHGLLVFSRIDHPDQLPELIANGLDGAITADAIAAKRVIEKRDTGG